MPELAVVGGHDSDGTTLFIGRAHHDGDLLPVKINPSNRSAYTCCEGYEIFKNHYEVLCGTGYSWMQCENNIIPGNAVSCGRTCEGEQVYIGRGHFDRSLTIGKLFRGDDCLYIPYGGRERRVHRYEVLIKDSFVVPAQTYETSYTTTYTKYEPGTTYVTPANTDGYYKPSAATTYVTPASTGGYCKPEVDLLISPAQTGAEAPPLYEKTPSYAGLYPPVPPTSSTDAFLKNEATTPYPPPPPVGFIKPEANYPAPTLTPSPILTANTASAPATEMPMPIPPPPYTLKEEVAVVHKKPPAFGIQVIKL